MENLTLSKKEVKLLSRILSKCLNERGGDPDPVEEKIFTKKERCEMNEFINVDFHSIPKKDQDFLQDEDYVLYLMKKLNLDFNLDDL